MGALQAKYLDLGGRVNLAEVGPGAHHGCPESWLGFRVGVSTVPCAGRIGVGATNRAGGRPLLRLEFETSPQADMRGRFLLEGNSHSVSRPIGFDPAEVGWRRRPARPRGDRDSLMWK